MSIMTSEKDMGGFKPESETKKRTFHQFTYHGFDLDQILDMNNEQLMELFPCRVRRKLNRELNRKQAPNQKTHLRDMVIAPEMVGSTVGVHDGKFFKEIEIKPEMIGHNFGEFSLTYKPVNHGRPGIGATRSSIFMPLK